MDFKEPDLESIRIERKEVKVEYDGYMKSLE